jgi:hypothetical protein
MCACYDTEKSARRRTRPARIQSRGRSMNSKDQTLTAIVHDTPVPSKPGREFWGSDAVAAMLRELDIPYIALVPGSSYRGLHDSLVNYLGNRAPQMIMTIH